MTTSQSSKKRISPLTASSAATEQPRGPASTVIEAATIDERERRFTDGLQRLRAGAASALFEERILMLAGGVLAPLGIVVVLLGWWGAAHRPYVFDQIPYLISGGLLGLGLIFLGAFLYFTHWLTQLVKEARAQSAAMLEAIQRLQDQVAVQAEPRPTGGEGSPANGTGPGPFSGLVATERGTMAHRADCVVVAGKTGLRRVAEADGLSPCKLCEPYASLPA